MSRNIWLIDMGFVVQAATDGERFKLDYIAGRRLLERHLGRTEAWLFNSIDPSMGIPRGLRAFYNVVQRHGFKVQLSEMTGNPETGNHRQQGVDEAIIEQLGVFSERPDIETLILTSGDAHFVPAVEAAIKHGGKQVILFAYDVNVSAKLKAAASQFWPFEEHEQELSRGVRRSPNQGRCR